MSQTLKTVAQVKINPWDKIFDFSRTIRKKEIQKDDFQVGDFLVIKIDGGTDLGQVVNILEKEVGEGEDKNFILRRATEDDFQKQEKKKKEKNKILKICRRLSKKHQLLIKIIDIHISLDGGRVVIAFVSAQRVDFRELVKDLSCEFHKSIRMHQINPREEIALLGRIGACGRRLCCLSLSKKLVKVSTDLIGEQQLTHRGPEKLSGICGRLKCCLIFESSLYKELIVKFPSFRSKVETENKKGIVVGWHTLRETIDFQDEGGTILEVPLSKIKKQKEE